jgi:hypothetical protein
VPIPLALSDAEIDAILRMAAPVAPGERGPFLITVGAELSRHPAIGIGLVSRIAADLQQRFTTPARAEASANAAPRHGAPRDRNRHRVEAEAEAHA